MLIADSYRERWLGACGGIQGRGQVGVEVGDVELGAEGFDFIQG